MDYRRFSTADLVSMGIEHKPNPEVLRPPGLELANVTDEDLSRETLRHGLESGGIDASMYYGMWAIWKTSGGFSGQLMQYRETTDHFSDANIDEALEKALEWGHGCAG